MTFYERTMKNRSCRSFDESRRVTEEELKKLVDLARISPSANNRQPLKYFLSYSEKTNSVIQPMTRWAGLLTDVSLPPEGHCPTAFIVILVDQNIAASADKDVGIAAQTMLLGAQDMGLSGCMIGAFRPEIHEALGLPEHLKVALLVALGKGEDQIEIVEAKGDVRYYRDKQGRHFVPKRPLEELIVNGGTK